MNDKAIRARLLPLFEGKHVVEEFYLYETRLDVAIIAEKWLVGYEIKGKTDSLALLPQQALIYSGVCQFAYLVAHQKHIKKAMDIIPEWWGVYVATDEDTPLKLIREAKKNPRLDSKRLLNIFWRQELEDACKARGIAIKGSRASSRLQSHLIDLPALEISSILVNTLRARGDWVAIRKAKEAKLLKRIRQAEWTNRNRIYGPEKREGEPPDDWISPYELEQSRYRERRREEQKAERKRQRAAKSR